MKDKNLVKISNLSELNILRGIAALFMIINHASYKLLPSKLTTEGIFGTITFIGSFAPVLFFFITGIGYGLQDGQKKKKNYWLNIIYKTSILCLADQFLFWREGQLIGLNFLGFIGFSIMIMGLIRVSKHPLIYALILIFSSLLLRYILGSYLENKLDASGLIIWLLGTKGLSNISYPFSPWITYPCFGYIFGIFLKRNYEKIEEIIIKDILKFMLFIVPSSLVTYFLWAKNFSFHRWGTVAVAFYVASILVLSIVIVVLYFIKIYSFSNLLENYIGLRGVSSLAIVPIHYGLISILSVVGFNNLNPLIFIAIVLLISYISFICADQVESWGRSLVRVWPTQRILYTGLTLVALCAIITWFTSPESSFVLVVAVTAGQILLCLLLTIRW
jgi:uncharacterized membrane protein